MDATIYSPNGSASCDFPHRVRSTLSGPGGRFFLTALGLLASAQTLGVLLSYLL